jgi:hypothetical protein
MRSRIEPMKKIARSLRQHRELILNYFRALSPAFAIEGFQLECVSRSYCYRSAATRDRN